MLKTRTLARKLLAVQRKTVASSSAIPTACLILEFLVPRLLPSVHTLEGLALKGDMGLSR